MSKRKSGQGPLEGGSESKALGILAEKLLPPLRERQSKQRLRKLEPISLSSELIDLTHNDYLGLRHKASFQADVRGQLGELPVGSGASRLLGGEHSVYGELEAAFSEFKEVESSLYCQSGYTANEMVGSLLALPGVQVFSDQLNHASIIDGLRLSRLKREHKHIFAHNDLKDLERRLEASDAELNIIWTESVFSMDGDRAPLLELKELADRRRGLLVVDEAHAIGVFGSKGQGLVQALGLAAKDMITINPCGKALASAGALITGPEWFRDYLINFARPFIYSTGPSPWLAHAVKTGLTYLATMTEERRHLWQISQVMGSELEKLGFASSRSQSQIIPVIVGSEEDALGLEAHLRSRGILAKAIRPPTVAEGSCRIRLSLHSRLSLEDIDHIIKAFAGWKH